MEIRWHILSHTTCFLWNLFQICFKYFITMQRKKRNIHISIFYQIFKYITMKLHFLCLIKRMPASDLGCLSSVVKRVDHFTTDFCWIICVNRYKYGEDIHYNSFLISIFIRSYHIIVQDCITFVFTFVCLQFAVIAVI